MLTGWAAARRAGRSVVPGLGRCAVGHYLPLPRLSGIARSETGLIEARVERGRYT